MGIFGEALLFAAIIVLMLVGLIGVIVPILPGIFLIWLGVFLYVWQTGFEVISLPLFLFLTLLVLVSGTSDMWLPYLGAQRKGAAKRSYLFATVGAIVGSFIVPIIGTIIGYVVGMFLGEYHKHGDRDTAVAVSWGGLKGWGIATVFQLVVGVIVIGVFVWQVLLA